MVGVFRWVPPENVRLSNISLATAPNGNDVLLGSVFSQLSERGAGEVIRVQKRRIQFAAFEESILIDVTAIKGSLKEGFGNGRFTDERLNFLLVEFSVSVASLGLIDRYQPLIGNAATLHGDID